MTSSSSPTRRIIDLVIQRSTIELFESYGIAIAPAMPNAAPRNSVDQLVGVASLAAPEFRAMLSVAVSEPTLARMAQPVVELHGKQDWIREVINQLSGRVKNKFSRYQLLLRVSLPLAAQRAALQRPRDGKWTELVYNFHTLKDDVRVTLAGEFDNASLVYDGNGAQAEEGDVILF